MGTALLKTDFKSNRRVINLNSLLDSISQGIQSVKIALNALEKIEVFLEQGKVLAEKAWELIESEENMLKYTVEKKLEFCKVVDNGVVEVIKACNEQYFVMMAQLEMLVNLAGYKGINLLKNQDLKVYFDKEKGAALYIEGMDVSIQGLNIVKKKWNSLEDVYFALHSTINALRVIRRYILELQNSNKIMTIRDDFAKELAMILAEGRELPDMTNINQDTAYRLAMQIRDYLSANSMSLVSEDLKSILKIF